MPRRLMAGQRPLKPSILVRVQAGHQTQKSHLGIFLFGVTDRGELRVKRASSCRQVASVLRKTSNVANACAANLISNQVSEVVSPSGASLLTPPPNKTLSTD